MIEILKQEAIKDKKRVKLNDRTQVELHNENNIVRLESLDEFGTVNSRFQLCFR